MVSDGIACVFMRVRLCERMYGWGAHPMGSVFTLWLLSQSGLRGSIACAGDYSARHVRRRWAPARPQLAQVEGIWRLRLLSGHGQALLRPSSCAPDPRTHARTRAGTPSSTYAYRAGHASLLLAAAAADALPPPARPPARAHPPSHPTPVVQRRVAPNALVIASSPPALSSSSAARPVGFLTDDTASTCATTGVQVRACRRMHPCVPANKPAPAGKGIWAAAHGHAYYCNQGCMHASMCNIGVGSTQLHGRGPPRRSQCRQLTSCS